MGIESSIAARPVVLVAAHPDDESIGAAGLLPRLRDPLIVHVTDGAPRNGADAAAAGCATREDYARARRRELLCALREAGIAEDRTRELGVADQEASFHMASLARALAEVFATLRPAAVLTHPYEGGHPDHDATAFAVHAACAVLPLAPAIFEFTSYHARGAAMATGEFLPWGEPGEAVALAAEDRERKRRMFACFRTQAEMLRNFPIDVERFRPAPAYDFSQPPHAGTLFYENFSWGITGERWRALAREAMEELGVGATA